MGEEPDPTVPDDQQTSSDNGLSTGEDAVEGRRRHLPATFASLRHRDYRLLWLGQVGHSGSLWMELVIRPVLILQLTDSALQVGLVVAARMAPLLLFGLAAGVVADRFDKRRILMACQSVTMANRGRTV